MIALQRLNNVSVDILNYLQRKIEETFKFKCIVAEKIMNIPVEAFNPFRKQYLSTYLLYMLLRDDSLKTYLKVLGVTSKDLYVPELNFVFGEAMLNGRVAVISTFRLRPEFYGEERNDKLFKERILKEAVHELGHTFGLTHCRNPGCVMHFSNSIIDTDKKSYSFCEKCLERLNSVLNKSIY